MDESTFVALIFANALLTAIVTPLLKILYKPQARLYISPSSNTSKISLQSTLTTGEFRILCCIHSEDNIHGMISILKVCNSSPKRPICTYAVHLIDLIGRSTPSLQIYNSQRKRFKINSTDRIMKALSKSIANQTSIVQPFKLVAPFNTIHESVCDLAREKYVPLILFPYPDSLETQVRKTSIRNFNINLQQYSSCTTGILVDRCLPRIFSSGYFTLNVEIIFFGGPDDREALALGLRMSNHPGVSTTLLRINLKGNDSDHKVDKCMDDELLKNFHENAKNNSRMVCKEKMVETTVQAMESIRAEKGHELIIVGKRQGSIIEKELLPWTEKYELGVIGDIVASSDFCEGLVSVLILQSVGGDHMLTRFSDEKSKFSFSSSSESEFDSKSRNVLLENRNNDLNFCTQV